MKPRAGAVTAGIALGVTACGSILGIHEITDDPAGFGDDAPFGDDASFGADSPFVGHDAAHPDGSTPIDAGACFANTSTDTKNCGSCGNVCGTTNATVTCVAGGCVFTCSPGYIHCGPDSSGCATAPAADPSHCGACDHDCVGATCSGGLCAATVLAMGQNAPAMVAVDDTAVYWTNQGSTAVMTPVLGDGAILRANKTDGSGQLTLASNQAGARGIFVDANQVYWANRTGGTVVTTAKVGGGALTTIASSQDDPWDVAADSNNYYWVDGADEIPAAMQPAGSVWMKSRAGTIATAIGTTLYFPPTLRLTDGFLYWPDDALPPNGAIMRAPTDGGPGVILSAATDPASIVVGDAGIYWTASAPIDAGAVQSLAFGASTPVTLIKNQPNPGFMAIDGNHLYWTDPFGKKVWRCNLDGSDVLLLAQGQPEPTGIAVDDQYLYWVDTGTPNATTSWYDNHDGVVQKIGK